MLQKSRHEGVFTLKINTRRAWEGFYFEIKYNKGINNPLAQISYLCYLNPQVLTLTKLATPLYCVFESFFQHNHFMSLAALLTQNDTHAWQMHKCFIFTALLTRRSYHNITRDVSFATWALSFTIEGEEIIFKTEQRTTTYLIHSYMFREKNW